MADDNCAASNDLAAVVKLEAENERLRYRVEILTKAAEELRAKN